MRLHVADNPDQSRVEIFADEQLAGFVTYHQRGDLLELPHTEVDQRWHGQGVAGNLVRHVLDEARRRGLRVLPSCPFVSRYIAAHHDYLDLVPVGERAGFGLPAS